VASTQLDPPSEPLAPLPRRVEEAREVLALVSGLITEHEELRNAVDALRRERDDLCAALERLKQEHERQVWLHTSLQGQTGALLAEIKQLVAEAKQKRRVAQDTSAVARGLRALP
jgi:chromosome segregation ATPase